MRSAAIAVGVAVLLAALAPSDVGAQSAVDALQGAWQVTEVVTAGPASRTLSSPQSSLLLFTGRHYSYTLINGQEPRPDLPRRAATAAELLTVWNPFSANAGTFDVSGDTMTRRPIVAKSPDAMAPGAFNEYTYRLSADTLWVTAARTEAGAARNPSTYRYVRVR
jgi:hypothetical protein